MEQRVVDYVRGRRMWNVFSLGILLVVGWPWIFAQAQIVSTANLAPTPPMGWASWNHFFCDYNEQTIRDQADALVSTGMRDLGYRYVLIQECIAPGRDAQGNLVVDADRFPHGMHTLTDYIHAHGLKAGIYTDIGPYTCNPKPRYQGSFDHEDQDARTFASWGMDLVEMDYCNRPPGHAGREIYERMAAAIQKTHRPMLFYLCSWGNEDPWTWGQGKAQLWRTTGDISPKQNFVAWKNVVENFELNAQHAAFSAANSWNDPDMLEVGNRGLSAVEAQSHFSMWVISAAPLWAGNDLTQMDATIRSIYTNAEAIAIDQDPLGAGPRKGRGEGKGAEVWAKPLGSISSGMDAVLLLNLAEAPAEVAVQWTDLGIRGKATVRDVWQHKDLGEFAEGYSAHIPAHGSVLLKVTGDFNWNRGAIYPAAWPGNVRRGDARLQRCSSCSEGYSIALQGTRNSSAGGSLSFTHIVVPASGTYGVAVYGVTTGSRFEALQLRANSDAPMRVSLQGLSGQRLPDQSRVAVELKKGTNTIMLTSMGPASVDIDGLKVTR